MILCLAERIIRLPKAKCKNDEVREMLLTGSADSAS
jgi:hypothetical protein